MTNVAMAGAGATLFKQLIDALGKELKGESKTAYQVRDHYAARDFDLVDVARATYRLATG